jgi:hypothetical protein
MGNRCVELPGLADRQSNADSAVARACVQGGGGAERCTRNSGLSTNEVSWLLPIKVAKHFRR